MISGFIVAPGPVAHAPSTAVQFASAELAIDEAKKLVAQTGIDREVWTSMQYRGVFFGLGRVRYISADGGSEI